MTAPAPEKAVRDPATGRYAHSGDLSRVCVCGHELGDHVHGGFECLGAGAPCGCEKFRPATEKAAPIPADVLDALDALETAGMAQSMAVVRRFLTDRAPQEERIREDEREACAKIADDAARDARASADRSEARTASGTSVLAGYIFARTEAEAIAKAIRSRARLRGGPS